MIYLTKHRLKYINILLLGNGSNNILMIVPVSHSMYMQLFKKKILNFLYLIPKFPNSLGKENKIRRLRSRHHPQDKKNHYQPDGNKLHQPASHQGHQITNKLVKLSFHVLFILQMKRTVTHVFLNEPIFKMLFFIKLM